MNYFFYGTLCHAPLLERVLGRPADARAAMLADYRVAWAQGGDHPVILAAPGQAARGLLLEGLTEAEAARLDFYEGGFGYGWRETGVTVATGADAGRVAVARVYFPEGAAIAPGADWDLAAWQARFAAAAVETAGDCMALMGRMPAASVAARRGPMTVRAASRLRAQQGGQEAALRRRAGPEDVAVLSREAPYAKFFAVEDWRVAWRQFDGRMGAPVERAVFVSCDAVTVLPYDPQRDRVLLVEQFRAGPMARGDQGAWQLEAIAGRIDPGESPEEAGRREAMEEAGLRLGALLPVAGYYPSPGIITEYLYSYVGLADLPDGVAGVFGEAEEAEDIRGHLIGFDRMMDLVASGEIANAPLILTALWLQRERGRLRAGG